MQIKYYFFESKGKIKNFVDNIKGILNNKINIHHLHISYEVAGYAHSFYNARVRENKAKTAVVAHNPFRFDFFFSTDRNGDGVWRTKKISTGGKKPTNISFASIGNQVIFLDTIKLNKIYNFQDAIIIYKIFEQRSERPQKLFKYNSRKCNSASSFSGSGKRNQSKCSIALPTDAENIRVFEKKTTYWRFQLRKH